VRCTYRDSLGQPWGSSVEGMDNRSGSSEFLASRRARITPEQAGLPAYGGTRRVPGLRRGEVATLAGVSVEYYTRLERGNLAGASEDVLDAVSRALQLDEEERTHLFALARAAAADSRARRRPAPKQLVRPGVQLALDAITGAFIRDCKIRNDAPGPVDEQIHCLKLFQAQRGMGLKW
jgi:transcriptional regulator with XRE-family HTH domain